MKTMMDLKDVFMGLSSFMVVKGGITDFSKIKPDFELPIEVDSLSMSQEAPTLNHYKVHGLQSDWAVSATPGEFTFSAKVPSVDSDMVDYFMGGDTGDASTTSIASAEIDMTGDGEDAETRKLSMKGFSAKLKNVQLNMGMVLLSEDKTRAVVVKKMAVYATPAYENASTTPFAFTLTGSIVVEDASAGAANNDDIAFLEKV